MADALMGWDKTQYRWRAMYKSKRLQIRASELGGTNYADTVVAANQWFREQQTRIDRELALKTPRPNELAYLAELENIRVTIKSLQVAMRTNPDTKSMLAPNVELLKHKERLLTQTLLQDILLPLGDLLRNPIYISPESIEIEASQEAMQTVLGRLRRKDYTRISRQTLQKQEGYISYERLASGDDDVDFIDNTQYFKIIPLVEQNNRELEKRTIERRLQKEIVNVKDEVIARKKEESGLIDSEFDRGVITQILQEQGIDVPESRKLEYHIDKFIEYHKRRCLLGDIGSGRYGKILNHIKYYKRWSPIINGSVVKISTKEHIDAYFACLSERAIAGTISKEYAKNLFATFKSLLFWFADEEILKTLPTSLQRKNRYVFTVERQKPKTVPMEWVHKLLGVADPRMKLCIMLTLNCGFGASEIGKLTKEEYDPATGRITHKRSKTKKSPNAPTVCYKLWDSTRKLLDKETANRKNYPSRDDTTDILLVNKNGNRLWHQYLDRNGKPIRIDNISSKFRDLIYRLQKNDSNFPHISYYQFRKTSASLIRNSHQFRTYNGLWLGHAPETMGDQHYNAMDDTILDDCIAWLHEQYFVLGIPSEEKKC